MKTPAQRCSFNFRQTLGFTLTELMIVVAVIAIIAAVGYPSYINSVVKTKRAAAQGCLSQFAGYMERYYTQNLRYDQNPQGTANPFVDKPSPPNVTLDCAGVQNSGGDYQFYVTATNDTYIAEASPQGAQATRDTACGILRIDQAGTKTATGTAGSATCWGN
jgi:type IV pilus assembly protein PilE